MNGNNFSRRIIDCESPVVFVPTNQRISLHLSARSKTLQGAGLRYPQLGGWGVGVLHFTLQREKSSYAHARAGARVCAFETEQTEHPLPEPFSEVCVYGTGYALIITMFTLLALPQPGLQTPCSIGFLNSNAFFVLRIPSCVGSIWRSNVVRSPANIASADSMPASVAMSRSVRLT